RSIDKGDVLLLSGTVRFYHGRQLMPREFVNLGADDSGTAEGRALAVYPATEGLSFKQIRAIIDKHLDALVPALEEYLPADLLRGTGLPGIQDALRRVHRPTSVVEAISGRNRLAYDELLSVHLLQRRANAIAREARRGVVFENKRDLTTRLKAALPWELTAAQVRATREIVADMTSPRRMHRLLQGDVGSGKTIVALFACCVALENGFQAAVMAPTELLAEQHFRTFSRLLSPLGVEPVLVVGSMSAKARKAAAARLAEAGPVLVVGTHALVQEGTRFARLGLAVIDEQHRFGVEQRATLGEKGDAPDVLLMSATPIPRSLALTLYGDLDVSVLDERPPGRQPVTTALRAESGRARVMEFVETQIAAGRQAYLVYPIIEESDKIALKAATTAFEALASGPFAHRRVALLHGRLSADEKDAIMRAFRDGAIDLLVSTTVIEVGIDVPNATVMVIEHPERFGLSQLHQLRGRVGRGADESFCILLGDQGPESRERLRHVVETEDGFEIARADLRLRGMGDLFGKQQSGLPTFRIADPVRDEELSEMARAAAERILAADPTLSTPPFRALQRMLSARHARALELFRVG
ncbi:MAG: ATP-dependent DNA helicase RecG, partial [Gemmatimonadaceae bacterium]|nr:ATP-dependent DNA helicase RecG [Gemmatimonadaceae bacterium]